MTEVGWASLGIIPSFRGFESKLSSGTSVAMSKAGIAGGTRFGDAAGKQAGSRFGGTFKKAAKASLIGIGALGVGALKLAGDSIAEARDAAKVGKLTAAAIKSTGGAARVSERHVGKLAGRLSNMAGVDDELIQSGANVLLTFTKIRNEAGKGNKVFDEGTLAALNMSAALKTDLSGASIQIGKALNDPIKGVTALGRAGVQFSEDQKAAIKTMVESGNTLGAQKMILAELNTQFKGAARSQADSSDKLSVAWGNLQEEIGTGLLPIMDDLADALRKKGIPAARDFFGWVQDTGIPAMKDFADEVGPVVGKVKDLAGFLNDLPRSIKIGGLGALAALTVGSKVRGGSGPLGTAGRAVGLAAPVRTFETNPAALGGGVGGPTSKLGKAASFASRAAIPVAIVAWSGLALKDFYDWNHKGDKNPVEHALTGGKMGDVSRELFGDPKAEALERAAAAYRGINDATKKLPNQMDQGKTAAQALLGTILAVGKADPKVSVTAPGFDALFDKTKRYGDMLDGLNGKTVTTFVRSVTTNNDIGEGGGGVVPGRSPSVQIIHNGDIRSDSPRDYSRNMQRRSRHASGGGVNIP